MAIASSDVMLRLAAAAVLAAAIGAEREKRHAWTAGLRTHMVVAIGACLFTLASAHGFEEVLEPGRAVLDPSRIAAQVVSGIGFLGAGAILMRKDFIQGLTTASSIWTVAAIGVACGGGMYSAAFCATAVTLIILAGFRPIEHRFFRRGHMHRVHVLSHGGSEVLAQLRTLSGGSGLRMLSFKMSGHGTGELRCDLTVQGEVSQLLNFVQAIERASGEGQDLRIASVAGGLGEGG